MTEDEDEDDFDEGEAWEGMCATVARRCGVSKEQVKAIADAAGLHAYGHAGIFDLEEVVEYQLAQQLPY